MLAKSELIWCMHVTLVYSTWINDICKNYTGWILQSDFRGYWSLWPLPTSVGRILYKYYVFTCCTGASAKIYSCVAMLICRSNVVKWYFQFVHRLLDKEKRCSLHGGYLWKHQVESISVNNSVFQRCCSVVSNWFARQLSWSDIVQYWCLS